MLQTLRIRNLALLEEISLEFEAGFTAVTGETGAGKSILLGALSLLAGERADKGVIRQGAAACEVEGALFFSDNRAVDALLAELELPPSEDGLVLLKRSLPRDKAPRISVNGSLATLSALQRLGEHWIDFHGPSEPRRLLRESCQLELLDKYARADEARGEYSTAYRHWQGLIDERAELQAARALPPEQLAFLREQLAKLDALDLGAEAVAALERDFQRMDRAQELTGLTAGLSAGLAGDEGVQRLLAEQLRAMRQLEALDPASSVLGQRLGAVAVELNDLAAEIQALADNLQFDPEQAADLGRRMEVWLEAKRRHGPELESVLAARDSIRRQIDQQGDMAGALQRIDARIAEAEAVVRAKAKTLRQAREKAAKELGRVAARSIAELGFKKAEFQVRLVPLAAPGPAGDCGCEFLFSPNVGEAPLPLSRIASSGELARVMLALKAVLADLDAVPVLVFDEVDANVGGEIGTVVGAKLGTIARSHQVLCVTHLPQVAAQADCHLVVQKDQTKDRAEVSIEAIQADAKARRSELARMLGDRTARSALAHAAELLASAERR